MTFCAQNYFGSGACVFTSVVMFETQSEEGF